MTAKNLITLLVSAALALLTGSPACLWLDGEDVHGD